MGGLYPGGGWFGQYVAGIATEVLRLLGLVHTTDVQSVQPFRAAHRLQATRAATSSQTARRATVVHARALTSTQQRRTLAAVV